MTQDDPGSGTSENKENPDEPRGGNDANDPAGSDIDDLVGHEELIERSEETPDDFTKEATGDPEEDERSVTQTVFNPRNPNLNPVRLLFLDLFRAELDLVDGVNKPPPNTPGETKITAFKKACAETGKQLGLSGHFVEHIIRTSRIRDEYAE